MSEADGLRLIHAFKDEFGAGRNLSIEYPALEPEM